MEETVKHVKIKTMLRKGIPALSWFEWSLIVIVMGIHLYAAFSAPHNFPMRWFVRDDAYYYFKVAQNISEGRGSTFDGINPTNGYHPLWLLICVPIFALARFDLILPLRLILVLMAALSVIASILLFRLLKEIAGEALAMLAAAYWGLDMTVHSIITQQGLETGLMAVSLMFFLRRIQILEAKETLRTGDFFKFGLAALFVLFSRLDGIYLALIAGIWMLFRRTSIRYFVSLESVLVFGVIVGAYIQRLGVKNYLSTYSSSAVLMSAVTFILQIVFFYFLGLYEHPKRQAIHEIFLRALLGVTLTAVFSAAAMLLLRTSRVVYMPRTIPLIYWGVMFILTLGIRLGWRALSPRQEESIPATNCPLRGILAQFRLQLKWLLHTLPGGMTYYGLLASSLLIYMGINFLLFGTFMPVSGQIKRWWGTLPNNVYSGGRKTVLSIFNLDPNQSGSWGLLTQPLYDWATEMAGKGGKVEIYYWGALSAIIATWLFLLLKNRSRSFPHLVQSGFIPLFFSAWIHAFIFTALGYAAAHEWYWTPQMVSLILAATLGLRSLLDLLPKHRAINLVTWMVVGMLSLALTVRFSVTIVRRMPYPDPYKGQPYLEMLTILEGYTEEGAIIGMTGGGSAGYFIRNRTVVNLDGLINSYAYFQALKAGQASHYLERIGLDYVFANPYILTKSSPYSEQFKPEQFVPVPGAPKYGQKQLLRFYPTSRR